MKKINMRNAVAIALLTAGAAQAATWTGGAGDGEFGTAGNWDTGVAPGTAAATYILGSGTHNATLSADLTRDAGVNYINIVMRNGGTFDIHADLDLGNGTLDIGTGGGSQATVTQDAGTVLTTWFKSGNGGVDDSTTLSGTAAMTVKNDMTLNESSVLTLSGSSVSLTVGNTLGDDLIMNGDGELAFVLNASGASTITVFDDFTVDSVNSQLTIDGSGYTGGLGDIPLVDAASMTGTFAAGKYNVTGLGVEGTDWTLTQGTNGDVVLNVIPEPATLGLIAAFGGGLLFVRRTFQI